MIGWMLSQYRILEKIGEGAMGVIFKARDEKNGRIVALKLLPPYISSAGRQSMRLARQRFILEAKAASSLDHPHIGTIYEIAETEGGETFIAMAHYEGENLAQKISQGPLELDEAIMITMQVAQALQKVHQNGIVHRDIKPANILLTTEDSAKLIDFGLAKLADTARITRRGTTVGTLTYMSPEQARGEDVDERTDLWSLGVVLFEMLTGQPPFPGDNDRVVYHNILNEEPLTPGSQPKGIPPALNPILRHALAKNRTRRYQSAGEFLVDLRELRKGRSL
jgi:serine/threonine-protein kinase